MIYYILGGVSILGVLFGIKLMGNVKTARAGNTINALCVAFAIILTFYKYRLVSDYLVFVFIALGLVLGLIAARVIKMIEMPQGIALLNGFGGLASALVVLVSLNEGLSNNSFAFYIACAALSIGVVTFGGSIIAAGKLHRILPQKPIKFTAHNIITGVILAIIVFSIAQGLTLVNILLSLIFGILFSLRVGGADMPITISLLNSLSGVAAGIAGVAVSDPLLTSIGGIVGASGLILTQIMCQAMNRRLIDVLFGKTSVKSKGVSEKQEEEMPDLKKAVSPEEIIVNAKRVIIVPGYGMALSQAQSFVKRLGDRLEENGAEVKYAIHPVAGRMPGHMNVLLCEVDLPYEKLYEMDSINGEFAETDLVIAVGANDVINPAANTAEGTPIYGMPVLKASEAKNIIVCNMDMSPGYSGVENPLYKSNNTLLLTGDAKESVNRLLKCLECEVLERNG